LIEQSFFDFSVRRGAARWRFAAQRAEVAKEVIAKFDDFTKLQLAEHEVEKRFETLRGKIRALLAQGEPKTPAETTLAEKIRAFIGKQKSPALAGR
jgi:hypothetical protein